MNKIYHNHLRTTLPPTAINDDLLFSRDDQRNVYTTHNSDFKNKNFRDNNLEKNIWDTWYNMPSLQSSLVYIAAETVGDYPYPLLTEKTWKAMLTGVPFMIVGAKHTIKKLNEFGFKTFNDFWDESYDNLDLVTDRIESVVGQLKILSNLSKAQQQDLKKSLIPTIVHNQKHLSIFREKDLANIREKMLK
jgi:hypothetical protein